MPPGPDADLDPGPPGTLGYLQLTCAQGQHTCDVLQIPSQKEEICSLKHREAASPHGFISRLHCMLSVPCRGGKHSWSEPLARAGNRNGNGLEGELVTIPLAKRLGSSAPVHCVPQGQI